MLSSGGIISAKRYKHRICLSSSIWKRSIASHFNFLKCNIYLFHYSPPGVVLSALPSPGFSIFSFNLHDVLLTRLSFASRFVDCSMSSNKCDLFIIYKFRIVVNMNLNLTHSAVGYPERLTLRYLFLILISLRSTSN